MVIETIFKQAGRLLCLLFIFSGFSSCSKEKPLEYTIDRPSYHIDNTDLQKYHKDGEIKIISFNVRYGTAKETNSSNNWSNRKAACLAMIKDQKPSCIGFQEAVYDIQFEWFKDQLKDQEDRWRYILAVTDAGRSLESERMGRRLLQERDLGYIRGDCHRQAFLLYQHPFGPQGLKSQGGVHETP